jgi:hypothetical protein
LIADHAPGLDENNPITHALDLIEQMTRSYFKTLRKTIMKQAI